MSSVKDDWVASQDDGSTARIIPIRFAGDVETTLQSVGPKLGNHDLLVLPPHQRGGESLYGPDDLDAVRLARNVGIDAKFLHESEDRQYLQEYSAGYIIDFAIALGANVTSLALAPLVNYIIARAQQAVKHRLHPGPAKEVPARLQLAYFRKDADGSVELEGLRIEGSTQSIADAVRDLFNPEHHTREGAASMEKSE